MKVLIFLGIIFLSSTVFAESEHVASCGEYNIRQGVSEMHFGRKIVHRVNTYEIEDPEGDLHMANIEIGSNGAVLTASKTLKMDRETGLILKSMKFFVDAQWSEFKIVVTDGDGSRESFPCTDVKTDK